MNELKSLFPIHSEVTQEILDSITEFGRNNAHFCIGAKTLKSALPENLKDKDLKGKKLKDKVFWGRECGAIYTSSGKIEITTKALIDMTTIKEPTKITFVLK